MVRREEIVGKYKGRKTNISIGITPSGIIHLGNMATLALAGLVAEDIGANSQVNLTICDLDIPYKQDREFKDTGFIRYPNTLPDEQNCHNNLLEHSVDEIQQYTDALKENLGVDFNIWMFSELHRKKEFREGLKKVIDDVELIHSIDAKLKDLKGRVPVYSLCPNCHTSSSHRSWYKQGMMLYAKCGNPDCQTEDISTDMFDPSRDLAMHSTMVMIRDKITKPYADIHVYGGDYNAGNQENGGHKIVKINRIIEVAGGSVPDNLFGPLFLSKNGRKMSKTEGNMVTMKGIKVNWGDKYAQKVIDIVNHAISNNLSHIDYNLIKTHFQSN